MNNFASPEERFWPRVQKGEGCWEWQGTRTALGYGVFVHYTEVGGTFLRGIAGIVFMCIAVAVLKPWREWGGK